MHHLQVGRSRTACRYTAFNREKYFSRSAAKAISGASTRAIVLNVVRVGTPPGIAVCDFSIVSASGNYAPATLTAGWVNGVAPLLEVPKLAVGPMLFLPSTASRCAICRGTCGVTTEQGINCVSVHVPPRARSHRSPRNSCEQNDTYCYSLLHNYFSSQINAIETNLALDQLVTTN